VKDMEKIKITVDLKNDIVKIVRTETIPIFLENKFRIKSDSDGYSQIERENGEYYIRNYLYEKDRYKMISEQKVSKKRVKELIQEILEYRIRHAALEFWQKVYL
jgi:hypothetical protein